LSLESVKRAAWADFVQWAKIVLYSVLIAVGIRSFLIEPFRIPSGSMTPTLLVGDYLFVTKFSYGYSRFSFPYGLDLFAGRALGREPKRGEVVVFRKPTDTSKDYVKRLIGLPGDRIQMKRGLLYINGEPVKRERIADYVDRSGFSFPQYLETLPNGVRHPVIQLDGDNGPLADTPEVVVQPGHYFMMGDNRDDSMDSRTAEVGQVPAENLIGPAELLFFSIDQTTPWWEVWNWPFEIRFGRLFSVVR
jgi:signal peptidase I